MQALAGAVGGERHEVELDVGQLDVGARAREGAGHARPDGQDAPPGERVLEAGAQLLPGAVPHLVEAAAALAVA